MFHKRINVQAFAKQSVVPFVQGNAVIVYFRRYVDLPLKIPASLVVI
jgi:hypothetical protein